MSDIEVLDGMLSRWQQMDSEGKRLTPQELCKDRPDLLTKIIEGLKAVQFGDRLLNSSNDTSIDTTEHTIDLLPTADTSDWTYGSTASNSLPKIPGFVVEAELGRGGMGVVYLARQLKLNRPVALKMILSADHASPETKRRFLAEAEAIAKLQHPGIIQVHEFGTHDGSPYFALEYVRSGSLDKKLAGTPLPPRDAAELIVNIADAVQVAHDAGIIHRDLKPANILISTQLTEQNNSQNKSHPKGLTFKANTKQSVIRNWVPKITDFGLVKQKGSDMTATGAILGTPSYMAPEQAQGEKGIGPTTDVYALGAILYECLSGRPPFKAATPFETILQVINEEPVNVLQLQAKTPLDLATICHKCLQKEPRNRFNSAKELAEECRKFLAGEPISTRPVGTAEKAWRWCKRNPTVATSLLVIAILFMVGTFTAWVLAAWAFTEKTRADQKTSESVEASENAVKQANNAIFERNSALRLLSLQAIKEGLASEKKGDVGAAMLWFTEALRRVSGMPDLELVIRERLGAYREWSEANSLRLTALMHFSLPIESVSISPDGQRLVTAADIDGEGKFAESRVWSLSTGKPITAALKHASRVEKARFSHDGTKILTKCNQTVAIWDVNTGRRLLELTEQTYADGIFSPCGTRIAHKTENHEVQIRDVASGRILGMTPPHQNKVSAIVFSTDDKYCATASWDGNARVWYTLDGKPVTPLIKHDNMVTYVSFALDGRLLLTHTSDKTVHFWDVLSGLEKYAPIRLVSAVSNIQLSTDNRLLLIASGNTAYIYDISTGREVGPSLRHDALITHAMFSPDRQYVVTACEDKTVRVWCSVSGQAVSSPLRHENIVDSVTIGANGRQIVTTTRSNYSPHICIRIWDLASSVLTRKSLSDLTTVVPIGFSANGMRAVAAAGTKIVVWDNDKGSLPSRSLDNCEKTRHISISKDGNTVFAINHNVNCIWNIAAGTKITLPNHECQPHSSAFSSDGKWIATAGTRGAILWNTSTGAPNATLLRHNGMATSNSFKNRFHSAFTESDGNARIQENWSSPDANRIRKTTELGESTESSRVEKKENYRVIRCTSFSPDGNFLVTGGDDHVAKLWDLRSDRFLTPPLQHNEPVSFTVFSPDNRKVLTVSDSQARVWDVITRQPYSSQLNHKNAIEFAAFSPDGEKLVSVCTDHTAYIWELKSGRIVAPLLRHDGDISWVGYSPDGRRILTTSWDYTARLWDPENGQPISPPIRHEGIVRGASFLKSSSQFATLSGNLTDELKYRTFDIHAETRSLGDLLLYWQLYACGTINDHGDWSIPREETELVPWFIEIKDKHPEAFRVEYGTARQWRKAQIATCMRTGNIHGALFHQNWLLAEAVQEASANK